MIQRVTISNKDKANSTIFLKLIELLVKSYIKR